MRVVSLPLHVWDRELDSRILLSVLLAEAGATVAIGHEYNISPIYNRIEKIFHYGAGRPIFNKLRTLGWYREIIIRSGYVGLVFEEGINDILHDEISIKNYHGINEESVNFLSCFFTWCDKDKSQILQSCPASIRAALNSKSLCASHSRIEMLGMLGRCYYRTRTSSIEKLFGNYILISDNFGIEIFGVEKSLDPTANARDFTGDQAYLQSLKVQQDDYNALASLARDRFVRIVNKIISANPHITFVFRPHPVASPKYWYSSLINARNLVILYRDSIEPWLFSCRGVLHSGCTVGLQAEIANVPSIDLSLLASDGRPRSVSNHSSRFQPTTLLQAIEIIEKLALSSPSSHTTYSPPSPGNRIDTYLSHNLSTLNPAALSKMHELGIELPRKSSAMVVLNEFSEFCKAAKVPDSSALQRQSVANTIVGLLGTSPPLPGKSRYYTSKEIADRLKTCVSCLGISGKFALNHAAKSNAFIVYKSTD